jgi:hypothetical protein
MNSAPSIKRRLVYPLRTAVAAVLAVLAAHLVGLREVHWAAISAVIVVQSDFGASLLISWHRLVGTALGAGVGAVLAPLGARNLVVYGCGVLGVGGVVGGVATGPAGQSVWRDCFHHRLSPRAPRARVGGRAASVHRSFGRHRRGSAPQCGLA